MMQNLDAKCAELGQRLGQAATKEREKLLTDGLGVLQEQGLYAFFLYLQAPGPGNRQQVADACKDFLRDQGLLENGNTDPSQRLRSLAERLDDLLLARELLMQALVYACYHAKAAVQRGARR